MTAAIPACPLLSWHVHCRPHKGEEQRVAVGAAPSPVRALPSRFAAPWYVVSLLEPCEAQLLSDFTGKSGKIQFP